MDLIDTTGDLVCMVLRVLGLPVLGNRERWRRRPLPGVALRVSTSCTQHDDAFLSNGTLIGLRACELQNFGRFLSFSRQAHRENRESISRRWLAGWSRNLKETRAGRGVEGGRSAGKANLLQTTNRFSSSSPCSYSLKAYPEKLSKLNKKKYEVWVD